MNKNLKRYTQIWLILVVSFVIVVFFARSVLPRFTVKLDARFWIAFSSIMITFFINLLCAGLSFREKNLKKVFYNIPLIDVSFSALIGMTLVGSALMVIPNFPVWITVIVCACVLGFNLIVIIEAAWASGAVQNIDKDIKTRTSFNINLAGQAESLLARVQSEAARKECQKIYDASRYSDPMSNDALSAVEAKIMGKMDELSGAVEVDDVKRVQEIAGEVILLIGDRNRNCKILK